MVDLTHEEQQRVIATMQYLRRELGGWLPLARALHFKENTLEKVCNGRGRNVTAQMAFRVARLAGASIDDLLAGRYRHGACPHCGHMPDLESDPTVADPSIRLVTYTIVTEADVDVSYTIILAVPDFDFK